jgi:uncharacterized membrane protein
MLPHDATNAQPAPPPQGPAQPDTLWQGFRNQLLVGLLVLLPVLVTFWVLHWLYTALKGYVIDPLAVLVIWKAQNLTQAPELPYWFEAYVAPLIAIILALAILYVCGVFAQSWVRHSIDRLFLHVPVVSSIYDAVRSVFAAMENPGAQAKAQRVVLVSFPHPGMRVPAFVTSTCRDVRTDKTLLCVYVPTTPIPTAGFFLIVPEEDVTELNWDVQQTLQAIISGGLTAPAQISYYGGNVAPPDGGAATRDAVNPHQP